MTRQTFVLAIAGLAIWSAPAVAMAEPDCFAATDAVARKAWDEARPILEGLVAEPACDSQLAGLRYTLAFVLEQQIGEDPTAPCAVAEAYAEAAAADADRETARAAIAGADRMREACQAATARPEPVEAPPVTEPESPPPVDDGAAVTGSTAPVDPHTTEWAVTAASAAALVAGGVLLAVALDADAERAAAEDIMRERHAVGDAEGLAAAEADFVDAADRATLYGISGYGALAIGAGLGVAAAWMWLDDGDGPSVAIGWGRVVVQGRF